MQNTVNNSTVNKIVIVGAGLVGATAAMRLAQLKAAREIFLLDVADGLAQGRALDVGQALAVDNGSSPIRGTREWNDARDADIVIVAAGVARRPEDTSRDDLLRKNLTIVRSIATSIAEYTPDAIVIVVTNPVEPLTHLVQHTTGFPSARVIGMAGVLDSARFTVAIADAAGVSPEHVKAMVLGRHGDAMVPIWSTATIHGEPMTHRIDSAGVSKIVTTTKGGGAEIVRLAGGTQWGPAYAVARMVEAIVSDEEDVLPCTVLSNGEYGTERGVYIGLPAIVGRRGVYSIVADLQLQRTERDALRNASQSVLRLMPRVDE